MYAELDRLEEAEKIFEKLVQVSPSSHMAHYYLGRVALEQRQYKAAEMHLREAVKIKPDFVTAMSDLADLYERMQQYSQAEEIYEKLIRLRPGGNVSKARLGTPLSENGPQE